MQLLYNFLYIYVLYMQLLPLATTTLLQQLIPCSNIYQESASLFQQTN